MTKKKNKLLGPKLMTVKEVVKMLRCQLTVNTFSPKFPITWITIGPYGSFTRAPGFHNLVEVMGSEERPELKKELTRYVPFDTSNKKFTILRALISVNLDFPGLVITWKDVYLADKEEPLTDTELEGLPYRFTVATHDYLSRAHKASTSNQAIVPVGRGFMKSVKKMAKRVTDPSIPAEQRLAEVKEMAQDARDIIGVAKGTAETLKEIGNMETTREAEEVPVEVQAEVTPAATPDGQPIDVDAHHATGGNEEGVNDAVPDDLIPEFDAAAAAAIANADPDGERSPDI